MVVALSKQLGSLSERLGPPALQPGMQHRQPGAAEAVNSWTRCVSSALLPFGWLASSTDGGMLKGRLQGLGVFGCVP